MKLCEYIDYCLTRLGVEKVFGIPGALVMPIWQNLNNKDIILCSHEQEASYVATGYAKMSRKPVCVVTTGGPGVTNCISGIAGANIDSVPLIYISGKTPISNQGLGERQEESKINRLYDSVEILTSITKKSICIDDISKAASTIWETMKDAVEARQGAVYISVPIDLQKQEIFNNELDCKINDAIFHSEVLKISDRPIFIIGWGAWMSESYDLIYELAEKVNAPVLVSSKAYCCINKNSEMYLGKLGYGYNEIINNFISEYKPSMIVSFGSSLGNKDISNSELLHLISDVPTFLVADDCSYSLHRNSKIIGCEVGDMRSYLKYVCDMTEERQTNNELLELIVSARIDAHKYWINKILPNDMMAKCISIINDSLGKDCVCFADAGNNLANAGALINPTIPGQMFIDVGLRAMGTGICTSVGMAIADKDKKYISITGDGCMLMNGNVMHIASEMKLPIVFIVFNNHSLGRVRVGQSVMNDYRATDINNVDYIAYAKAFGLKTFKAYSTADFNKFLIECINGNQTSLIEVVTDSNEIPVSVKDNIY